MADGGLSSFRLYDCSVSVDLTRQLNLIETALNPDSIRDIHFLDEEHCGSVGSIDWGDGLPYTVTEPHQGKSREGCMSDIRRIRAAIRGFSRLTFFDVALKVFIGPHFIRRPSENTIGIRSVGHRENQRLALVHLHGDQPDHILAFSPRFNATSEPERADIYREGLSAAVQRPLFFMR